VPIADRRRSQQRVRHRTQREEGRSGGLVRRGREGGIGVRQHGARTVAFRLGREAVTLKRVVRLRRVPRIERPRCPEGAGGVVALPGRFQGQCAEQLEV
jgi:hypothetical protein